MYNESTFTDKDMSLYLDMNPEKESLYTKVVDENPKLSEYEVWQLLESM